MPLTAFIDISLCQNVVSALPRALHCSQDVDTCIKGSQRIGPKVVMAIKEIVNTGIHLSIYPVFLSSLVPLAFTTWHSLHPSPLFPFMQGGFSS